MKETLTIPTCAQHIAAGTPILVISTDNEQRACQLVQTAASRAIKELPTPQIWSCDTPFAPNPDTDTPLKAIRWALAQPASGVYIFLDMHWYWDTSPEIQRLLIEFAHQRVKTRKTLVFIANEITIPSALNNHTVHLHHPLPNAAELSAFLEKARHSDPFLGQILAQEGALHKLVIAAQGLDLIRLERALRMAKTTRNRNAEDVIAALHRDKKQALEQTGIIEFVENNIDDNHVGGMGNLKHWMAKRERAFGIDQITQGENLPSGVLLMGISGCGKSLFVKAIAARWGLPLVKLDMATVYAGTHGTPEYSLHRACQLAEAMSPCVLWIDEIESGISEQGFKAGGGSSSRVLGYFLTWMQEKNSPVFVAATANAIETLPAEVLRKGRFDEIFYIALPGLEERREIFRIHLKNHGLDPDEFEPTTLSHSSKGFSGAEIEQAVSSAKFEALADQRNVTTKDIMEAIGKTVPISTTMAEQIKKIEAWAFQRAVPASEQAER